MSVVDTAITTTVVTSLVVATTLVVLNFIDRILERRERIGQTALNGAK